VIGKLQNTASRAKDLLANMPRFEAQLDQAGTRAEGHFDSPLYAAKSRRFSELARLASGKAEESLSSTNATIAAESSEKAEIAFRNMAQVDDDLNAMEKDLHEKLHSALSAMVTPRLALEKKADHQQHKAHAMMDPLYSWGDAAEDKADALNDQTNDALSSADKALRIYNRHIVRHAQEVQRGVESRLFAGADRSSTWLEVHKQVNAAVLHAEELPGGSAALEAAQQQSRKEVAQQKVATALGQEAAPEVAQQQKRKEVARQKANEATEAVRQKTTEVTVFPTATTTTTAYDPFVLDPLALVDAANSGDMPLRPSFALAAVAVLASGGAFALKRSRQRVQGFGTAQSPLLV